MQTLLGPGGFSIGLEMLLENDWSSGGQRLLRSLDMKVQAGHLAVGVPAGFGNGAQESIAEFSPQCGRNGIPLASQSIWILVVRPPRLLPRA